MNKLKSKVDLNDEPEIKELISKLVVLKIYGDKGGQTVIVHNKPSFFRKIFLRYLRTENNFITWQGFSYHREPIVNEMMLVRTPNISTKIHYQVRKEGKPHEVLYCKELDFLTKKESWKKEAFVDDKNIKISLTKPSNVSKKLWTSSTEDQKFFIAKLFNGVLDSNKDEDNKYINSQTEKTLCAFHVEGHNKKVNATHEVIYKYKNKKYNVDLCDNCFTEFEEFDIEITDFWGIR